MKIVCIDNKKRNTTLPLTIGKVYETNGGPAAQYTVMCDNGVLYDLSTWRFISLEGWREKQLNELLK